MATCMAAHLESFPACSCISELLCLCYVEILKISPYIHLMLYLYKSLGIVYPISFSFPRLSTLENKYLNIFFYKTTGPTVLKFHMEHDLTPGSQNYKSGSGRENKMAAVTKNSNNHKINFFCRITGYLGLNFGMDYQWNIGIQNCKNKKNL